MSLSVVLTFPLCFSAVRYLPPLFHHPVWLWGEWSESKVHSWDAWNSEKFIDLDEYMEAALGRIFDSFANLSKYSPFHITADAAENTGSGSQLEEEAEIAEELPPNKIPVLSDDQSESDSFLVRKTIYSYYIRHLNFWGHPYEEQGFQLKKNYWIGHAHNIFLQYGTDFGTPVMVLFAALIIWGSIILWRRFNRNGSVEDAACWMYLLIPAVFGMFEYAWGVGSLSIIMLFTAWGRAVRDEE